MSGWLLGFYSFLIFNKGFTGLCCLFWVCLWFLIGFLYFKKYPKPKRLFSSFVTSLVLGALVCVLFLNTFKLTEDVSKTIVYKNKSPVAVNGPEKLRWRGIKYGIEYVPYKKTTKTYTVDFWDYVAIVTVEYGGTPQLTAEAICYFGETKPDKNIKKALSLQRSKITNDLFRDQRLVWVDEEYLGSYLGKKLLKPKYIKSVVVREKTLEESVR